MAWHIPKKAKKCHPALCSRAESQKDLVSGMHAPSHPLVLPIEAKSSQRLVRLCLSSPHPHLWDLTPCSLPSAIAPEGLPLCLLSSSLHISA